jgi:hypothetical protein
MAGSGVAGEAIVLVGGERCGGGRHNILSQHGVLHSWRLLQHFSVYMIPL